MSLPFQFQLPSDLPSSMVHGYNNYICYSLYANIDVAWKLDITTRMFFTVIQPNAAATMLTPLYNTLYRDIFPQCCIPPCCCFNIPLTCFAPYGNLTIAAYLDRTAYAPGEIMYLKIKIDSSWAEAKQNITFVYAKLSKTTTLWADGHYRHDTTVVSNQSNVTKTYALEACAIQVPSLPPSRLAPG